MPKEQGKTKRELSGITIGAAFLIGLLVIAMPFGSVPAQITAYAAGNDDNNNQSQDVNGHGRSGAGNGAMNSGNQTSSSSSAYPGSQGEEHRQNGSSTAAMSDEGREHSKADEKRMQYASETAKERHEEHLAMHSPIAGPYAANMNYTLTATGTATSVSDNSTSTNASISLDFSVWKSTKGLVSMDIMNGTITVGNETIPIHNGHAYYILNNHQFRVLGFITSDTNTNSTSSTGQGNQTASASIQMIKLVSKADKTGQNVLPTSSSSAPLKVSILSPQSKLASEWFLKLNGEVKSG